MEIIEALDIIIGCGLIVHGILGLVLGIYNSHPIINILLIFGGSNILLMVGTIRNLKEK